jgi:hypothetical protein
MENTGECGNVSRTFCRVGNANLNGILGGVASWQRFSAWSLVQATLLEAPIVTAILPSSMLDFVADKNQ